LRGTAAVGTTAGAFSTTVSFDNGKRRNTGIRSHASRALILHNRYPHSHKHDEEREQTAECYVFILFHHLNCDRKAD
jgi:ADP-heptose:LPS heptosyltransferase